MLLWIVLFAQLRLLATAAAVGSVINVDIPKDGTYVCKVLDRSGQFLYLYGDPVLKKIEEYFTKHHWLAIEAGDPTRSLVKGGNWAQTGLPNEQKTPCENLQYKATFGWDYAVVAANSVAALGVAPVKLKIYGHQHSKTQIMFCGLAIASSQSDDYHLCQWSSYIYRPE